MPVNINDLRDLKSRIKDSFSLCGTFGTAEAEHMVATTIHACVANFDDEHGIYSIKGSSVDRTPDNRRSYQMLLANGYLVEGQRDGQAVIEPTEKLVEYLKERI